jgi:membrane-bound ClpP family serine protease
MSKYVGMEELREEVKTYNWMAIAFGIAGILYIMINLLAFTLGNLIVGVGMIVFSGLILYAKQRYLQEINKIIIEKGIVEVD